MRLTFCGGVGEVTGSNYLLESGGENIMIDCGLHQGSHYAEHKNFEPFAYNPRDIKAVFVTHSHIDHIGLLPKLWKDGFRGTIYSTPPTKDFAELLLLDSEHILLKEADREKKQPLYTTPDIENVMALWRGVDYHEEIKVGNFSAKLLDAGHILGSAIVKITVKEAPTLRAEGAGDRGPDQSVGSKTIVFSGDLGNYPAPIIQLTEKIDAADYCVIESTYGDKIHEGIDKRREMLEDAIEDAVKAGGVLIIPTFAMERTQELLYHLHQLFKEGRVPRVPVFIDSPLAIKLTAVYKKYENYFNPETEKLARSGDDILNFPGLRLTLTTEQSKEINNVQPPKVIIAGSGMSQGGRILHHEYRYLPGDKNTILFVGYQAVGSLGRQILNGADHVRIFGEDVRVRCKKIAIGGYSAHADQPLLLKWVEPMRKTLKKVFVVQGEEGASETLAVKIRDELAVLAVVPRAGEVHEI